MLVEPIRKDYLDISTYAGSDDTKLFMKIVNQGIDSHLEAVTRSEFLWKDNRLHMRIHRKDIPVLIRRLEEIGTDEAISWAEDIRVAEQD
jgi:hypothetical protein